MPEQLTLPLAAPTPLIVPCWRCTAPVITSWASAPQQEQHISPKRHGRVVWATVTTYRPQRPPLEPGTGLVHHCVEQGTV